MLRPDADPGEVFAVGGAFAGLAAEYFQRRGVEGRSVRNAEYVVGGDHYMQSYQKTDDSKTESCPVRQKVSTSERGVTPPKVMKKLKRDSSRSRRFRRPVNAKTTTRGPDASAPQSLFSHLYFWPAMFRVKIYVLSRQSETRRAPEQLSRLGKAPLRCKRKNNNPRSGCIRPAVVVFAFMPSAFALPLALSLFLDFGREHHVHLLAVEPGIISTLANSSRSVAKSAAAGFRPAP